jgi:hypothetical protein
MLMDQQTLVNVQNFILATRDSGYKNTASALAELIDNAIEAHATKIEVVINKVQEVDFYEINIIDNGKGMTEEDLNLALQFGGSSRFNSRTFLGRYGMGLPNSSLSQCKRVEVITWKNKKEFISNYLDVDEVIEMKLTKLPEPQKASFCSIPVKSKSGTIVQWKKCDRLSYKYLKSLIKHIVFEVGRIFRYALWKGVEIIIAGEKVVPFDPLSMNEGVNLVGGSVYGDELTYQVKIPNRVRKTSEVKVRFVELPVQQWAGMSNEDKRRYHITKSAGVSILRAGREIDYGWFFMGAKRKENYDDWWRCEISFNPELDEVFGVTHTKQEIKQTEFMNSILIPDLEQTARTLNNRVRLNFISFKKIQPIVYSKQQIERTDIYLPPLKKNETIFTQGKESGKIGGFQYKIVTRELKKDLFFDVEEDRDYITLIINTNHLFYDKVYKLLHERDVTNVTSFIKILELLIFSAARSEFSFIAKTEKKVIANFMKEWSSNLKTIIS